MATIIVLAGGNSDERAVSLRSGIAVSAALKTAGHLVRTMDPATGLEQMITDLQTADAVFPALHGIGGEDGSLQAFFEDNNIWYVGSDSASSTLCFDKARYTTLLEERGYTVPKTALVNYDQFMQSDIAGAPYVLKPNDGGSSIDTFIVRSVAQADAVAIQKAFQTHQTMLLQELIEGTEITVGMLGSRALPVIEIIPPTDQEFDYENKYNGATQELCPPVHLSALLQSEAQQLAHDIHELTGCRDMSRTDMIVAADGSLYILETNTIPGLTDQSLLPKAAAQAGLDMPKLCDQLVTAAVQRAQQIESL